jgi:hypothetical protein
MSRKGPTAGDVLIVIAIVLVSAVLVGAILGYSSNRFRPPGQRARADHDCVPRAGLALRAEVRETSGGGPRGGRNELRCEMTTTACPRCGKPLAPDAPGGLCASCLIAASLNRWRPPKRWRRPKRWHLDRQKTTSRR